MLKDSSISPSFASEGVAKGPLMYNGVWSENKLKSLAFGSSFNATTGLQIDEPSANDFGIGGVNEQHLRLHPAIVHRKIRYHTPR